MMIRRLSQSVPLLMLSFVGPALASAQQASGIAGVVRDTSGGVLPGVTVEASSPALLEKVRSVVTDAEGRYNIVDLRPGPYTVSFSLTGFSGLKREGVELTAGFTATVNAELKVGALEETITVTGSSPLVDIQNTRQQQVVSREVLNALPTSTVTLSNIGAITPGMAGQVNVGGSAGAYSMSSVLNVTFHGKSGGTTAYDGMRITDMDCASCTGPLISPATVDEWTVETGGGLAESDAAGVRLNVIPRSGGNTVSASLSGSFSDSALQTDNLTDALRDRGLTSVNGLEYLRSIDGFVGGPLKQDKLWYFVAGRYTTSKNRLAGIFYNATQGTPFYTPDPNRPGVRDDELAAGTFRLTWQANQKDKFTFHVEPQRNYVHRGDFAAPEAMYWFQFWPLGIYQATWNSVRTNKLLIEASAGAAITKWPGPPNEGVGPHDIPVLEQSTNFLYNSNTNLGAPKDSDRLTQRASVSYVTGSHAFKGGMVLMEGIHNLGTDVIDDIQYIMLNQVPNAVVQYATPYVRKMRLRADLALYAQDRWSFKRLTLNYGVRFDYFNAYVPEQSTPASTFVPAREFAAVHDVPNWTDINPRLGASYDLFGNGRTALRMSLGRYVFPETTVLAAAVNPIITSVNSVTRTWNDRNGNVFPDCDLQNPADNGECGAFQNVNFGKNNPSATRYAEDVTSGFAARPYNWDIAAELQHELRAGVSITGGYYHNWFSNFPVTNNLAVTPADYSPFCVTAPPDSRLPGGGGYDVCGLYDVSPAKLGQLTNLVTQASNFGDVKLSNDFFNVNVTTRLGRGVQLGGGVDTGQTTYENCNVVSNPQEGNYARLTGALNLPAPPGVPANVPIKCGYTLPFSGQTQVKAYGSYPLPWDFVVSGTLQNVSGPMIMATWNAPNSAIAPTLGRNLAACGTQTVCTATAQVPLIEPGTEYESRRTQVDLRVTKQFRVGQKARLEASLDLYNAFNDSSVLNVNGTYGSQWLRPIGDPYTGGAILQGRLVQFAGRYSF
jgi:hypothetical protein